MRSKYFIYIIIYFLGKDQWVFVLKNIYSEEEEDFDEESDGDFQKSLSTKQNKGSSRKEILETETLESIT